MSKNQFHITPAVLNAYLFIGREWRYLAGISTLPMLVNFVTMVGVNYLRPDASIIEDFLWGIPATAFSAWFMFGVIRLLLLGEKVTRLPQSDPDALQERHRRMQGCAIAWLLFNMALLAIGAFLMNIMTDDTAKDNTFLIMICMFMIGACFWGVRFSVAHLLIAIGYPVRRFMFSVDGVGFSFRLIGLGLMGAFPIIMILKALISLALPMEARPLSGFEFAFIAAFSTVLSFAMSAILTSAVGFAFKEMLGTEGRGRPRA